MTSSSGRRRAAGVGDCDGRSGQGERSQSHRAQQTYVERLARPLRHDGTFGSGEGAGSGKSPALRASEARIPPSGSCSALKLKAIESSFQVPADLIIDSCDYSPGVQTERLLREQKNISYALALWCRGLRVKDICRPPN